MSAITIAQYIASIKQWLPASMSGLAGLVFATLASLALSGCVGGGTSSGADVSANEQANSEIIPEQNGRTYPEIPLSCEIEDMRQWVDANMRDYYLFYDQVPDLDLASYTDLQALVTDMQVKPFDRFSYITDAEASSALFNEGRQFGFGWRLVRTSQSDVRIGFVYPQSPLAAENVQRGDFLLSINNVHPLDMTPAQWDSFLGTGEEVVTVELSLLDTTGETRSISVTKADFLLDTVLDASVFPAANGNVGYMAFTSFLETSNAEIDEAFATFQSGQVTDLILDLRYNGGGRISVANKLASKIAGAAFAGQVFAEISWNDKYSEFDEPFNLVVQEDALDLSRVIVLSSSSTCSASEMIINGLKPFVDVVQIGGTSCGKPYGSSPREACGKAMSALQFRFVNANGEGDYYQGIPANCGAIDDMDFALGNPQEGMLAAGLGFINSGTCQSALASIGQSTSDAVQSRKNTLRTINFDPLESEKNLY